MGYHEPIFLGVFLPVVMLLYQLCTKKLRPWILLLASYVFFWSFSRYLVCYLIGATIVVYVGGLLLEKAKGNRKKWVLGCSAGMLIGVLGILKYSGFVTENVNALAGDTLLPPIKLLVPIGISFYTLQGVAYLVDVYWEKYKPELHFGKIALYMGFFPHVLEGPICLYDKHVKELWSGEPINGENLKRGIMRITWGLLKKMIIADRLYILVSKVYDNYRTYSGLVIVVAAICYTVQLYMEFSGCMDIVIGTAKIFGVTLPENFRLPFVSKNAGEFWRRWHITLGTWFKTYIFYPVSISKPVKKWNKFATKKFGKYVAKLGVSAATLFPVWLCNGIWHGAQWGYIFYGMYYFVILLVEAALEPIVKKKCAGPVWDGIRMAKTWVIIFTGELFFRAERLSVGLSMFGSIFKGFTLQTLWDGSLLALGLSIPDFLCAFAFTILVAVMEHKKEAGLDYYEKLQEYRTPVRWGIYYAFIFAIIIFGAYGTGYQKVELIYAQF